MTSPFAGFIFNNIDTDPLPPSKADFSVIGIVLPSDDANASVFGFDAPAVGNSGDSVFLTACGTGPLYKAVKRINAQLAALEASARIVVVRVATGVDDTHTIANILGDPSAKTGMYALLKAPQVCNVTPRLIAMPGFTGQTTFGLAPPVIAAQGSLYVNPTVTFNPAGATATAIASALNVQATGTVALSGGGLGSGSVGNPGSGYPGSTAAVTLSGGTGSGGAMHATVANGVVTGLIVDTPGTYTVAPTIAIAAPPAGGKLTAINLTSPGNYPAGTTVTATVSGGGGSGAALTLSLQQLANPICAALPGLCAKLLAHAPVGGPGGTVNDAINWRTTLPDSTRLIPQDDWEIVPTNDGLSTEYIDGVARSLGLAVATDFEHGGYPFWAWANRPVVGALGVKRPDGFSLVDGATDGQVLLTAGIGITARGDLSDTSLDDSGYVAFSVSNASSNALYNFYNKTRGRDYINLALLKSIRRRLGGTNITLAGVDAVLNDMAVINIELMSKGCVIGFRVGFKSADNTVEGLRAGKFTVYDNTEEPAPIIQITINRGLDRDALANELEQIASSSTVTN